MTEASPILIAGGGIGGLTLAALFQRRGVPCLVLERAPRFAPVGAGIVMQPNAIRALRAGGLEEAILPRGLPMERLEIRDDRGVLLSSLESSVFRKEFGTGAFGFHRSTLHDALMTQCDTGAIRLDSLVASFEQRSAGVVVILENGERLEGSALIGADGLKSAVRRQMLRDGDPDYSGYTSWRGVTARGSLWPQGQMCESWGRGARVGLVPVDGDRLYWFATANTKAGGRDASKPDLLKRFEGWHAPIAEAIESTSKDAIVRTDISDRPAAVRWSEGRVTLMGDAAHPMTPNLGQGGCQAIEDAVVLDACLARSSEIATAFKDFERRRFARAGKVVTQARRLGRLGQLENSALRKIRNFAIRKTPQSATIRSARWLYEFDPTR